MDLLKLVAGLSPTWAVFIGLVFQAAISGWFVRGLKADRDRMAERVTENASAILAHVAATKLAIEALRNEQVDLEQALGIQGSQMLNLAADYDRMTDLVLNQMPKIVQGAVERAETRGEHRARRRRAE